MSWGFSKGAGNSGAPMSGKAQRLNSNEKRNKDIRGPKRPGQWGRDTKRPGK